MEKLFSASKIAELAGCTQHWVRKLKYELIEHGHAVKIDDRCFLYYESAGKYIKEERADGRGKWDRAKKKISQA